MKTIVPIAVATAVLALLGAAASSVLASGSAATTSSTATTVEGTTVRTAEKPGRKGTTRKRRKAAAKAAAAARRREPGEDVRGPCDEAEHASDPRCAGGRAAADDRSGPGRGGDRDARRGDDRSGSDSGSG